MSATGYLETLANPLPVEQRKTLIAIIREGFGKLSFGSPAAAAVKATNFDGRLVPVTTSGTINQEVAVGHGLARKPRLLIPCLDPNTVNATLPDQTITRAADATYFYLTSTTTNATFWVYAE